MFYRLRKAFDTVNHFVVIIPQLTHMYNCSFMKNIFLCKWKIAKVIPMQKPGNKCDVNNLRPVSLLPLPGKITERLAHTKLRIDRGSRRVFGHVCRYLIIPMSVFL